MSYSMSYNNGHAENTVYTTSYIAEPQTVVVHDIAEERVETSTSTSLTAQNVAYTRNGSPTESGETAIAIDRPSQSSRGKPASDELSEKGESLFGDSRDSYQMRALVRKTLSYQKRQTFTNVCCILLCPLMMVAIAGIMGIVITNLINNANTAEDYLFCSNVNASDSLGIPHEQDSKDLPELSASQVPNAPKDAKKIALVNYYIPPAGDNLFEFSFKEKPCVYWLDNDYPFRQPYEINPNVTGNTRRDTTPYPDVPGGWLGPRSLNRPDQLYMAQLAPWAYVRDASNVNSGEKPRTSPVNSLDDFISSNQSSGDGVLGSVRTNYWAEIVKDPQTDDFETRSFWPYPYFDKQTRDVDGMDDLLSDHIRDVITRISKVTKAGIEYGDTDEKLKSYIDLAPIVQSMPWGNILFDRINHRLQSYAYTLQTGTDFRFKQIETFPQQGLRRIVQQSQLTNAFLRSAANTSDIRISHGFRVMPLLYSTKVSLGIGSLIGSILYPFGVSFLLPIFVITIVKEKEDRILVMMRMNGLKTATYYAAHYIHFYTLHILTSIVFIVSGVAFRMEFFTLSAPIVYILLFFFWGHVQIALAFFFSVFFSKSRTALIVSFLFVLVSVVISLASGAIVEEGSEAPSVYFFWPPFAFYRALDVVNTASVSKIRRAYRAKDLKPGDEAFTAMIAMIVEFFVFMALAFYLSQVLPSEYGVPKRWHYIFTDPYKKWKNRKQKQATFYDVPATLEAGRDVDPEEIQHEDGDVKAERERVLEDRYPEDSPLVMKRMRKVYGSGKLAVKDVTFAVERNIIFGLLGPNGAGKTTLISILTGLYPPTKGVASLNGFDTRTQMDSVYLSMGVCPQHDILWDDLTVGEHLLFYARLKGVAADKESKAVDIALGQVRLAPFRDRLTNGLSGGEKRRLSIAIALIGNPTVVFLDEPTTGLDPEVRRLIWNIIQTAKAGRTIVLTTHSMEEAEVLCNRIGIMAKGTLRCLGPQLRLKEVYGRGFKLSFTCRSKNHDRAVAYIESLLPENAVKLDSFVTNVSYEFEGEHGLIPRLFEQIEKHKKENGVDDWGLSQTTLEEVFLRIISDSEAEA